MWKERAGLMVDNEKFLSWKRVFKGAKYIIIIEQENADEEGESLEEQMESI